ncbi:MAG TPA: tetratricopeptide repeat protein [Actinomycetes bacterium]|nr:tetratricopeptide repeat protein [Actinomycetes bacterium]
MRLLRTALVTLTVLALAATVGLTAGLVGHHRDTTRAAASSTDPRGAAAANPAAIADASSLVSTLQARLEVTPKDQRSWSQLALAYAEQGRITADPTYYPKAQAAIARAAHLAPGDSVMLAARATLQAARHDFTGSLHSAEQSLRVNPFNAQAEAIRCDALTELGRYAEAPGAAARADDLDPGSSTFARLSYQRELRGDLADATALMRRSLQAAGTSAPSYAFAAFHLGDLAHQAGRPATAMRWYRAALGADPTYLPALDGVARLEVARGQTAAAVRDYRAVVTRLPLTEYLVELGELYQTIGRPALAEQQYAVATASARLLAANGVAVDLETAQFQADHGSPAAALSAARGEWARRHSISSADALGWALYAARRDASALRYARLATRLGTRDARAIYHLGVIEAALHRPGARSDLLSARRLDAGVSPYRETRITAALRGLR